MEIHREPSPAASGDFRGGGLTEVEAFASKLVTMVTAIGLAVTILGLLLSIAFGIYIMNAHIDALGADFNIRIEQMYQLLLPEKQ